MYTRGEYSMTQKLIEEKRANHNKWIFLKQKEIKHLYLYYIIVLVLSFLWLCFSLVTNYVILENGFPKLVGILMLCFPGGVLGSVIYYIRKFYKSLIQNMVVSPNGLSDEMYNRALGAKLYFYLRPIISGILSVIINIGIISGLFFVNEGKDINNNNYFLMSVIISFFIGFSNGKLILKLDSFSENMINNLFKGNTNNEKR